MRPLFCEAKQIFYSSSAVFLQASVAHTFDMFAIDIIDFIAIIVKTTADVGCLYRQTSFGPL